MTMQKAIKLMIVDDHTSVRQTIASYLKEFNFQTIYQASNGKEAIALLKDRQPDVVLMDIEMPLMNGLEALQIIKQDYPAIKVIMLSGHCDNVYVTETMKNGADAFLPKHCSMEVLMTVINDVYENKPFIFEKAIDTPLPTYIQKPDPEILMGQRSLTSEEVEILIALCEGKTMKTIAEECNMPLKTISSHTDNIYKKTFLTTKIALVKYAVKNGYISFKE